jgi:hypothetical protein
MGAVNPVAKQTVDAFAANPAAGKFPHLDRATIAAGLLARLEDPTKIDQGHTGLCPSAAVVYTLARTNAVGYAKAVTELFDQGKTKIGDWTLDPCDDLRNYAPPSNTDVPQVDWIIMASIRDSENWFIDYQSESDNGGAWGNEVAKWLRKAGYKEVVEDWNYVCNKTIPNLKKAEELYEKDYQVCLLIDKDLLEGETSIISRPNHWVVLADKIATTYAPKGAVYATVFTWGKKRNIPAKAMILDDFIDYYYGFVAAKF